MIALALLYSGLVTLLVIYFAIRNAHNRSLKNIYWDLVKYERDKNKDAQKRIEFQNELVAQYEIFFKEAKKRLNLGENE
jgi:hypothetical protein